MNAIGYLQGGPKNGTKFTAP